MIIVRSLALLLILAPVVTGCGGTAIGNGNNDRKDAGKNETAEDESVTIPTEINGATLTCTVLAKARSGINSAYVGCGLVDANANKVDVDALKSKITLAFSVSSQEVSGITVDIEAVTTAGRAYDAIAEVKGGDVAAVNSYAETMNLSMVATSLNGETKSLSSPEPVTTSKAISSANWNVSTVGAEKYAVDLQTGLKWMPNDGSNRVWQEAFDHCANATYAGITSWRLPLLGEAYVAAANGIQNSATSEALGFLNLGLDSFWMEIPESKKVTAPAIQYVDVYDFREALDQTIESQDEGGRNSGICVAD